MDVVRVHQNFTLQLNTFNEAKSEIRNIGNRNFEQSN